MDAKSFVLGVLAGVAGFALVDRLMIRAPQSPSLLDSTAAAVEEAPPAPGTQGAAASVEESVEESLEARPQESAKAPAGAPIDAGLRSAAAADTLETRGEDADWPRGFVGSDPQTAAARAAESRDVAWSYQAEQLLTQYLATHPPAAHFEIRSIDCRTTFCQIRAVSSNPDASPIWVRIGHDIGQQAWSDFSGYGTSTGIKTPSGREALIMFLPRKPRTR